MKSCSSGVLDEPSGVKVHPAQHPWAAGSGVTRATGTQSHRLSLSTACQQFGPQPNLLALLGGKHCIVHSTLKTKPFWDNHSREL